MTPKSILSIFIIVFSFLIPARAQWLTNGTNVYYNGGNVGIGITAPAGRFHVFGGTAYFQDLNVGFGASLGVINTDATSKPLTFQVGGTEYARLHNNGNFGIGTNNPQQLLHIFSTAKYPRVYVQSTDPMGAPGYAITDVSGAEKWTWHYSIPEGFMGFFLAGVGNQMIINNNGHVGIGTTSVADASYRLFVETGIRTRKITVDLTTWPDYVFGKEYLLDSLSGVEKFISQHAHLPGIPSAGEIKENGLDLGQTQALLLKKIEELTLYVIQQNKTSQAQQERIDKLERLLEQKTGNH
jgi:hypothetical protein